MAIIQRDPFAPRYEIIINESQALSEEMKKFISEVRVEDDAELMDKISLKIDALNTTEKGVVQDIIDSKLFAPGNLIEVKMGYGNSLQTVGAGYIVRPRPQFLQDGPVLEIEAYDIFHKLAQKKSAKGRSFKGFRDSQCMTIIAADHQMDYSKVRKFPGISNRFQKVGQNDYEFLKEIADERNWDFYNRYDPYTKRFVLYFEPPTDRQKEVLTFEYFEGDKQPDSTLLEFLPEIATPDQASEFKIISWDRKKKKKITTFFKPGDLAGDSIKLGGATATGKMPKGKNGSFFQVKAFGQTIDVVANKKYTNEEEAKLFIEGYLKRKLDNFITGKGKVIGLELLQSRQKHIFKGIGNVLNGKYYLTNVTHIMTRGDQYITEFSCRKVVEDV